ncbi:restriction endonuclease fold toxin-2 domain-containing protein [Streptomyces sp. NPDC102274]|uniref:restriction endonuclease fold toxin-2 domain-containing protein n=1 Tax=Streptomyces sp. NPDC102274 TaxID=3366151 RepID=UPI003828544F
MSDGLAPHLKLIAEGMIRSTMGLATDVMRGARDTMIALSHELDRQKGMAGDDDAGRDFAKVYKSAASTTLNHMGFSSYVLGESGRGLMRNAREFMVQESRVVASIIGEQVDLTSGMGDPGADCPENYLGLGQELPEVVGETAWHDQYAPGGGSDRSLDRVEDTLAKPVKLNNRGEIAWDPVVDAMYGGDEKELVCYKKAMANPANGEIRGLEIVTNGRDNAAYWQSREPDDRLG